VLAENQRRISDELELAGCALNLGAWNKIVPQRFTASVLHLFENPCLRKQMSCKSMSLIDGEGALRVASALSEFIS
jgi:spore coat polysaccharide biosynthesis predicted glycosyltransferase SpsG